MSPNTLHIANCEKGQAEKIPPGLRWKKYSLSQAGGIQLQDWSSTFLSVQVSPSALGGVGAAEHRTAPAFACHAPLCRAELLLTGELQLPSTSPAAPGFKGFKDFQTRSKISSCETHQETLARKGAA